MLKKRFNSFRYAFAGIASLFRTEANMKIHVAIGFLTIIAGFFFSISQIEWCIIIITIASVLAAEGFNTAIEHLTDLASPNFHPLAGKAKDVAAGAVLLITIGAIIVGIIIFLPHLQAFAK